MKYELTEDDIARFWAKVIKGPDCWQWTGTFQPNGRPSFWLKTLHRDVMAYRISYFLCIGDLPDKVYREHLDHQCNNKTCVNPAHLKLTTARENILRSDANPTAINSRKDVCKRGHPLVAWSKTGKHADKGWRKCATCKLDNERRLADQRNAKRALRRHEINARQRELYHARKHRLKTTSNTSLIDA